MINSKTKNGSAILKVAFGLAMATLAGGAEAATDTSVMYVGTYYSGPGLGATFWGDVGSGSLTPNTLTGGKTVSNWYDYPGSYGQITISGFTLNPGQSWLTSAGCTGLSTLTGSTATGFTWTSSTHSAQWIWTKNFGFDNDYKKSISCSITHM